MIGLYADYNRSRMVKRNPLRETLKMVLVRRESKSKNVTVRTTSDRIPITVGVSSMGNSQL
jgi:hypothetical protein